MSRFLIVLALALAVSACASAPKSSYSEYLAAMTAQRAVGDAQAQAFAEIATNCTDARCVENVAALAALSRAAGKGESIAPPPREISGAEKFAQVVGALSPIAGTLANAYVTVRQSEASERSAAVQWDAIGGIVNSATGSMATVASNSRPWITVGGDYVQGDGNTTVRGQIGDRSGGDLVRGNQYQGDVAGRDQIGRDQVVQSHIGDSDRYESPGPYEGVCTGTNCQGTPPPDPEPEP